MIFLEANNVNLPTPLSLLLVGDPKKGRAGLFESQSDLARQVVSFDGSSYAGKQASVRSLIQQIFTGARKVPAELEGNILLVVGAKYNETTTSAVRKEMEQHNSILVPAKRIAPNGQTTLEHLQQNEICRLLLKNQIRKELETANILELRGKLETEVEEIKSFPDSQNLEVDQVVDLYLALIKELMSGR